MTLLEVTFELETALDKQQLWQLGQFANTYGLRKVHVDDNKKLLRFEYDASRLRELQIEHVLRSEKIPVKQRVQPAGL